MALYLLTEIGDQERGEEGTSGERDGYLKDNLGDHLLNLIAQAKGFDQRRKKGPQAANVAGGPGFVKRLAAWHTEQIKNVTYPDWLDNEIIRYRQWLTRQGAALTADGQIIWKKSHRAIVYDHQLESQNTTKVSFRGGLMFGGNGKPLDTRTMSTAFSGPGAAIYVMSKEGNLHVTSHSVGHRHHSSMLAGASVAGAGELKAESGRLLWLSNKSGHYFPDIWQLLQTIELLDDNRALTPSVKVTYFTEKGRTLYNTVDDFFMANHVDIYSLRLMQLEQAFDKWLTPAFFASSGLVMRTSSPGVPAGVYVADSSPPQRVPSADFIKWMIDQKMPPHEFSVKSGAGR